MDHIGGVNCRVAAVTSFWPKIKISDKKSTFHFESKQERTLSFI
jgi:hypothetical protein